jgi:uncharacterized protein YxjI
MKIKIKRATIYGLKDAEGELIKLKGYQFCLVKSEGLYFVIELTTGCSVITINDTYDISMREGEVLKIAKESIKNRSRKEFEAAINHIKNTYCRRYKFNIPVNEPIY